MNLTPLHDRIVVARLEDPEPLPGIIVVPDSAKEKRSIYLASMANQVTYGDASRQAILRGVNRLANAVKVPLGGVGSAQ